MQEYAKLLIFISKCWVNLDPSWAKFRLSVSRCNSTGLNRVTPIYNRDGFVLKWFKQGRREHTCFQCFIFEPWDTWIEKSALNLSHTNLWPSGRLYLNTGAYFSFFCSFVATFTHFLFFLILAFNPVIYMVCFFAKDIPQLWMSIFEFSLLRCYLISFRFQSN